MKTKDHDYEVKKVLWLNTEQTLDRIKDWQKQIILKIFK